MIAIRATRPTRSSIQHIGRRIRQVRFRTPPISDQRHLIEVAGSLSRNGADVDLVAAGLLHDIGKAAPGVAVRLPDRVAKVLLECLAPDLIARLALRERAPRIGSALWVLARHAQAGAEVARQAGYNERVQWLIAHHERRGLIDDSDLRCLIAADESGDSRHAR